MLNHGHPMVAIPGPSIVPERVLGAMHRSMPNIYGEEMVSLAYELLERLPHVARTSSQPFVVISNGHGAWDMAICNTLCRGDKVLVLESGRFATAWGKMASVAGVDVEVLAGSDHLPVDTQAVAARLDRDPGYQIKAVLVAHTDTASSVRNDILALSSTIRDSGHPALFMVDCIASLACERYEMDAWGVDLTVAASQKGMMVPPGLGFVFAGPRAIDRYEALQEHPGHLRTGYLDWGPRIKPEVMYELFAGTPPIQHMYALREALDIIDETGLEAIWERHTVLAEAVRSAIAAWSTPGGVQFNISDPAARSNAVTTVLTGNIDADELRRRCELGAGLSLGVGIGSFQGRAFRIGHMGHLNPPAILGTLGTVESALLSMDAPMNGSGVAAAASSIATKMT